MNDLTFRYCILVIVVIAVILMAIAYSMLQCFVLAPLIILGLKSFIK